MHMRQLVTFAKLSNDVDTTGTGSMHVVARRVAISYAIQRHFRKQYGCQPPTLKNIWFWDNKLTTGVKSPGNTRTSEENVNRITEAFPRSPCKSICAASLQLCTNSMFNSA
jgi:hypothetical protein